MSLPDLPTEILFQIFRHCSSISSAINLSLTCHRLYHLLRTSQKIPVLFAIAERVWGPLEDVYQILTYNSTQPLHVKRAPVLSFALLVQVSRIGRVATWFENMYPKTRWDSEKAYLRRELAVSESRALRRAIYRTWLFSLAFHTPEVTRTNRMHAALVANRCRLLRTWSTDELLELEDARCCLENILASVCPTSGQVFWNHGADTSFGRCLQPQGPRFCSVFYDAHAEATEVEPYSIPAPELRDQTMEGWGDDIDQYHILSSMLKLNPSQVVLLYENALCKRDVEVFVDDHGGGNWFWDNGETMLHTWMLVLHDRGLSVHGVREKISSGLLGIAVDDEKYTVEIK
ncbi:hypothetical protein DV736_g1587, partial [Chaetothyriales sp. CBS 134916]